MKKEIIMTISIILFIIVAIIAFAISREETANEIVLGKKTTIKSLEKINIKGTNDTFEITKKVKWQVPEAAEGTTVSFSISIPYKITVDGKEYKGTYELNDSAWSNLDKNPKYNIIITDLTTEGIVEVLISKK